MLCCYLGILFRLCYFYVINFCVFCRLVVLVRLSVSASDWLERLVSETTCNVLMGTLNPTHSLTHSLYHRRRWWMEYTAWIVHQTSSIYSGACKGFPLFSALRMASPDTIMLSIIVNYHAVSHWAKLQCLPLTYSPEFTTDNSIVLMLPPRSALRLPLNCSY